MEVVSDEAEYQRLLSLKWRGVEYRHPPLPGLALCGQVAQDDDNVVVQWYSAQPPPNFDALRGWTEISWERMYLEPHYSCFACLRLISTDVFLEAMR